MWPELLAEELKRWSPRSLLRAGPTCCLEGGGQKRDGRQAVTPIRVCPSLSPAGVLGTLASGAGGGGTRAGCEVPASEGAVETSSTSAL